MLMTAIAIQTTSRPMNPAGCVPAATAIALIGTPRAIEVIASAIGDPECSRRYRADCCCASRVSTRASISRPTLSRNDSITAS